MMTDPKSADDDNLAEDGDTEESIDLGEGPKDTVRMSQDDIERAIRERELADAEEAKEKEEKAKQKPKPTT